MKKILILFLISFLLTVSFAEEIEVSNIIHSDESIELIIETPEPTATPTPKIVTISCDRKAIMKENEPVHLTSKLIGFENCTVSYQWQCDKGNGFEDIIGATGSTHTFYATQESLSWDWRLKISYK